MNFPIDSVRFNFLYIDHYIFTSAWKTPTSYIPYSMIRLVLAGEALFEIDNQQFLVKKGDLIYIPQGSLLFCEAHCVDFQFISLRFNTSLLINETDFLREYYQVPYLTHDCPFFIQDYLKKILQASKEKALNKTYLIRGYLDLLIAYLVQLQPNVEPDSPKKIEVNTDNKIKRQDARIQLVVDYIVTHPYQKYTMEELSKMATLSESAFRRLFKEQTGKSPTAFINDLKMVTASKLLLETTDPVNAIAYSLSFDSANYFVRIFKRTFGMTPTNYRKLLRE